MKRLPLLAMIAMIAVLPTLACAQSAPDPSGSNSLSLPTGQSFLDRLGGTYSVDLFAQGANRKRKVATTQAVTYRSETLTNVLPTILKGRLKTNIDLDAIAGLNGGTGALLGFGGIVNVPVRGAIADQLKLDGAIAFGPSLLYNTDGRGFHVGFVLGFTAKGR